MRNYQPKKKNPYLIPHNLYMRVLYLIRDYDRLIREREKNSNINQSIDDMNKKTSIKLELVTKECEAVEAAISQIPKEYISGVLNNICHGAAFPIDAGAATYGRWRCKLVYYTAKNLSLF